MGARPSSFKKGGGFLDNVDVTIKEYTFTDEFNGEPFVPGKIKGSDGKSMDKPHSLNAFVSFRTDGATEDTTVTLKVANDYEAWEIEDDGHTIVSTDGSELNANTAFSKLINSLVNPLDGNDGFPEERLPEDKINYESILGTRVRLVQQTDVERTKKFGQKKDKKTGKAYDRKDLLVYTVYEIPEIKGGKGKSSSKPVAGKKVKDEEVDTETIAVEALKGYLSDAKDNTLTKGKIKTKVLTDAQFKGQSDVRDAVIKWLYDDDNLEGIDGVTYSRKDKSQNVTLD